MILVWDQIKLQQPRFIAMRKKIIKEKRKESCLISTCKSHAQQEIIIGKIKMLFKCIKWKKVLVLKIQNKLFSITDLNQEKY